MLDRSQAEGPGPRALPLGAPLVAMFSANFDGKWWFGLLRYRYLPYQVELSSLVKE